MTVADEALVRTLRQISAMYVERDRLREALEKLANPTHQPKGEEANLLQMEVQQIARDALSRPESERG